jgi:hypothetical protein
MIDTTTQQPRIRMWQQNVNKSLTSQLHLLNAARPNDWDIILLQEPWIGSTKTTRSTPYWRVLYPNTHFRDNAQTLRSLILINTNIPTNSYDQIHFPTQDVTGARITRERQSILLINVYNACNNSDAITAVSTFLKSEFPDDHVPDDTHVILLGDFNRHHAMWEDARNAHLTSSETQILPLLDLITDFDLRMALPPTIPTLQALSTGNWTRPDNVWCTNHSLELFTSCTTDPGLRGPNTDHLPILSTIDIPLPRNQPKQSRNFREVDWRTFNQHLTTRLSEHPQPQRITTEGEFRASLDIINNALKATVEDQIPISKPLPHTKRWWTSDLTVLRKARNRLANVAYRWRATPNHPAHQQLKTANKEYAELIKKSKKEHWENWLTNASERDVWTANKYATDPPTDGGRTRMPTLKFTDPTGEIRHTNSNQEKSTALANSFFPPPPARPIIPHTIYPRPADIFQYFTPDQIRKAAKKLEAYKAPGPDGIPNVVLKKTIDTLIKHVYYVFRAIFELNVYPDEWKESITVVLRKPGKPSYEEPKAYRPIALLNTLGKLFSSIVADDLSHFCESRQAFPANQFGGRPARTTSDSMLLLTHRIKEAWRHKKVASVLFLDVQGAFPNVVKEVLIHNMRKRAVPERYVLLTERMLTGRKTKLSFDDFFSDFIAIDNGNNQGCPLSMIFYAFYNAGLLEISPPTATNEQQFGYVDDVALLAIGDNLMETHGKLNDMMTRTGGAFEWSKTHNSKFELSKLALMDFTTRPHQPTALTLTDPHTSTTTTINPSLTYRFLGVLFDPKLKWNAQTERAGRSASAWINLVRRLARTTTGISAKGMRQLYTAIAIPKMSYAAEVWYTTPHLPTPNATRRTGSIKFTQKHNPRSDENHSR